MPKHINQFTGIVYVPTSFPQAVFLVEPFNTKTALTGKSGTGKTTLGVIKVLNKLYSGLSGALIANNFPKAQNILFQEFCNWVDPMQVHDEQRCAFNDPSWLPKGSMTFKFSSGAKLFFAHEGDAQSIQSLPNLNFCFMDEPKADLLVKEMMLRCRFKYLNSQEVTSQFWITCRSKEHLEFLDLKNKGFEIVDLG